MGAKRAKPKRGGRRRRVPLVKALPVNVLAALNAALRGLSEQSVAAVNEIHRRLNLLDAHGVTPRQTLLHARRIRGEHTPAGDPPHTKESGGLDSFRRRITAIGQAMAEIMVGMESPEADLWGRGLYLRLVGKLYEALESSDLSLADLRSLSKMICEQRRAQAQAQEVERRTQTDRRTRPAGGDDASADDTDTTRRESPERLGEMVRRIYGVNLPEPS